MCHSPSFLDKSGVTLLNGHFLPGHFLRLSCSVRSLSPVPGQIDFLASDSTPKLHTGQRGEIGQRIYKKKKNKNGER